MLKVHTGIDTLGIRIESFSKIEIEGILNSIVTIIANKGTRLIIDNVMNTKTMMFSNKKLVIIHNGGYGYKDNITNTLMTKYYINVSFIGLRRYNRPVDDLSFSCMEEVFGNLNVFGIKYKITELDIYTDIDCSMENLLVLCNNKLPNTKYHPLDKKFYGGNTVYIEDLSGERLGSYIRRAYLYNKAKKENIGGEMSRFEIKLQKPFFINKVPSLLNIWKTMTSYSFLLFSTMDEKQAFIEKYNSYSVVGSRELKRMGIKDNIIELDVSAVDNTIYYLENYKSPRVADAMITSAMALLDRAKKIERENQIHAIIGAAIVKVMNSLGREIIMSELIKLCYTEIVTNNTHLDLPVNEIMKRVEDVLLKSDTI